MSTVDALVEIAKNLGPAVTGVGGALATLWKTTRGIFTRLEKLEEQCKVIASQLESNDNSTKTLDVGFREFDRSLGNIRASLSNFVSQTSYSKTLERLAATERRVSEMEEELDRIDRTLVGFAREQSEQWQSMNRSLGQLEGFIKGRTSRTDE